MTDAISTDAALDAIHLVSVHLRDAAGRLAQMSAHAAALSDSMNWQTAAATRFHTAASAWRDEVVMLAGVAEVLNDDVMRLRYRLLLEAGGL